MVSHRCVGAFTGQCILRYVSSSLNVFFGEIYKICEKASGLAVPESLTTQLRWRQLEVFRQRRIFFLHMLGGEAEWSLVCFVQNLSWSGGFDFIFFLLLILIPRN